MQHTLILGTSVGNEHHSFGKLSAIVVDNGVANQVVVNPTGLFSGPERLVPISDLAESSSDLIRLECSEVEWKAYSAANFDRLVIDPVTAPAGLPVNPENDINREITELATAETASTESALGDTTVVLRSSTSVGGNGHFSGLVIDTGVPQAVLVGDQTIPFDQVSLLDEKQISLGGPAAEPHTDDPARAK